MESKGSKNRKAEHETKMARIHEQGRAVVASGKCPVCGSGLHRNLSFAGWWQCNRSGSGSFRLDPTGNHCDFDCFTE